MRIMDENTIRSQVLKLAQVCDYEREHSHQVSKLALKIFDGLQGLHQWTGRERFFLEAGSLLHDIGWVKGRTRHHKTGRDLILECSYIPLDEKSKRIVALIVRYHRRAFPQPHHKYFSELGRKSQKQVCGLASFLRVADALDLRHCSVVKDVRCDIQRQAVVLELTAPKFSVLERQVTKKKADLFEKTFQRKLILRLKARSATLKS